MKSFMKPVLLVVLLGIVLISCKKDDNHIENVNREIYEMMQEVYLWYDYLPRQLDPGAYATPNDFMEALRYPLYDKWSFVMTKDEYDAYFVQGEMIGHGFLLGLDDDDNVRVCFVYRFTEAAEKGVKRSWIIKKINGTTVTPANVFTLLGESELGVTNTIDFINEVGSPVQQSLTKEVISLTPVLHYEVMDQGDKTIGYMVFQDFIKTANDEMDEVFDTFLNRGVNEVIIDLRYNGGGYVNVAEHMAGWLIGKNFARQTFLFYEHNNKLSMYDTIYNVPAKSNGMDLDRVFFIGTENTASASELIITGVKPFIGSIMAGSTTHGKPVGMYGIPVSDYMAFPVCFRYLNHDHEGDFYDGLLPDLPAADDLTRDFGDPEEASLKAILHYIETGTAEAKSAKSAEYFTPLLQPRGAIGQFLKAY